MIVYKSWLNYGNFGATKYDGWFLFGILPLYIRKLQNVEYNIK